ncbi:hypothetical protein AB4K20DRAFT_1966855 [Rhizopus microsporus]
MFGKDSIKLKGNRCGVTDVFWRALSKVCNACSNDSLTRTCELKGCSVLVYINACKNMLSISLSIWNGRGLPSNYRRN